MSLECIQVEPAIGDDMRFNACKRRYKIIVKGGNQTPHVKTQIAENQAVITH